MSASKKTQKFNFQEEALKVLLALGAKKNEGLGYDYVIDTIAGPLECAPYEDWLATRFMDVAQAKQKVGGDRLNPHSGKWNWHYTNPGPSDMLALARSLASVILSDKELESEVTVTGGDGTHTRLTYMYRDGSNNKTSKSVVFPGRLHYRDLKLIAACCDRQEGDHFYFIPGEVEMPDLQDSFAGCESEWDDDRDHPFHQISAVEMVSEPVDDDVLSETPAEDLSAMFLEVAKRGGWGSNYRPHFYEEMAGRRAARLAREAREAGQKGGA